MHACNQLPKALVELDELISYIEQMKFQSSEKATEVLKEKISPILSVAFDLHNARERLDGMAEMVILPPEPPQGRLRRNNEE